jgi:WD40 repeat protein
VPNGGITYTLAFSPNSYNLVMGSENGDVALWSLSTLITGTKEIVEQNNKTLFYPNPASNFIHFNSPEPIQELRIYSITGQILMHQQNAAPADVSQLSNGMYFVQINNTPWQQLHIVH